MKNVRYQFIGLCLGLGFLVLAPFSLVHAQHVPGAPFMPLPYDYFETAGRLKVTQPIGLLTLPGGKRLFDNADLDTDGGSGVRAKGGAEVRNPSGNPVKVDVSSRLPNNTVGGALGRATGKILKSLSGPLGVGVAIWELYKELGFDLARDLAGDPVVRKLDPDVCTAMPCYEYQASSGQAVLGPWRTTAVAAAMDYVAYSNVNFPTFHFEYVGPIDYTNWSYLVKTTRLLGTPLGEVQYITGGYNKRSATSVPPSSYLPSTQQEFLDAVAAKSGWPSSSAISRALSDAVAATGDKLISGSPTVSGPATSPGTTSVTNNTTNNTTKTETVTHHHTYAGDTVTTTSVTNVTIINNVTGDTISNETTTSTPTPAPTPDQCKDYPDSAGCAKLGQVPDSDILTKKTEAVSVVAVAFAGGSCPPPVTFSVMSQSYSFSYGSLCDRLAVLKFLFLAIAGVLAAYILADSFKV